MTRNRQDTFLARGFAGFSVIASFAFVYYGIGIITAHGASRWLTTFAYITGGYGLANIYILSWAWRTRMAWTEWAIKVFALCYLGAVAMDTFRDGLQGTHEVVLVLVVACVLWINWFSVKKAITRPE